MNDYKTYEDVQDAYGMGMITQAEYDAVRDALDRGEAYVELETPKSAALKELRNYISTLTNDIVGYEVDISQGYPAKRVGFHRIDPRDQHFVSLEMLYIFSAMAGWFMGSVLSVLFDFVFGNEMSDQKEHWNQYTKKPQVPKIHIGQVGDDKQSYFNGNGSKDAETC